MQINGTRTDPQLSLPCPHPHLTPCSLPQSDLACGREHTEQDPTLDTFCCLLPPGGAITHRRHFSQVFLRASREVAVDTIHALSYC